MNEIKKRIKPLKNELYLVLEGEGICDQCGKDITEIIHFEKSGDLCRKCFDLAIKQSL